MKVAPLQTPLRVHLYTIGWNEEAMLGFFFRHYDPWISRYVFYDDGSTDGTLAILAAHPRVEVRRFERVVPDSFVLSARELHNSVWKESRRFADWVVLTAVDEHLHHPQLPDWLMAQHESGVTLIPALGYEMASAIFPSEDARLCDTVTLGVPSHQMNKLSLFRPDALKASRYTPGRHGASPTGNLVFPARDELRLLHYKFLGDAYATRRQAMLSKGLGARDIARGLGRQYAAEQDAVARRVRGLLGRAIDTADPSLDHHATHLEHRWWRPEQFPPNAASPEE
jgi:hypothetical protein